MGLKIRSTDNIVENQGHFLLLYGKSKSGKTTAMKTLEGKTLVIDADEGITSLDGADGIDYLTINESTANIIKEMKEVFEIVDKNIDKYDNFVLDTFTALSKMFLDVHMKGVKDGRQAYGALNTSLYPIVKKFEKLARQHGKNVVFTAQVEVSQDENEKEIIVPSIDGQKFLTKVVMPRFDGIIALEVDAMQKRWFITRQSGKWWSGIRDAHNRLKQKEPANFAELFKTIKGK